MAGEISETNRLMGNISGGWKEMGFGEAWRRREASPIELRVRSWGSEDRMRWETQKESSREGGYLRGGGTSGRVGENIEEVAIKVRGRG
eukprot:766898-Hanusia_phi.AAC.1